MAGAGGLPFISLPRIVGRARDALEDAEKEAAVYLRGTITWESALKLKKEIEVLAEAGIGTLDLMISSGGGSADAALMLVDLIESLEGRVFVRTIVDGVAASAATLVSVAGHERWIHKRGWLMLHLPSISSSGPFRFNSEELAVTKKNMDLMVKQMEDVYKRNLHTKPKKGSGNRAFFVDNFAAIKKELEQDNYIRAERCLELHLVDHAELPARRRDQAKPRKNREAAAKREKASLLLLGLAEALK
jgi:ATP-dependent protease ClpP protease subunit